MTLPIVLNGLAMIATGISSWWPVVWVLFFVYVMLTVVYSVVANSLRQAIVPSELQGRVGSVARFISWGVLPIGALLGGALVTVVDLAATREAAVRAPYLVEGVLFLAIYAGFRGRLTDDSIARAKRDALAPSVDLPTATAPARDN